MGRRENPAITAFILMKVEDHPNSIASLTAKKFGVSRTTVNKYMQRLVRDGKLAVSGKTKARRYVIKDTIARLAVMLTQPDQSFATSPSYMPNLLPAISYQAHIARNALWAEDEIWRTHIAPHMQNIAANIVKICHYGFTEMFNNLIDHSLSPEAVLALHKSAEKIEIVVQDYGVGIFEKIRKDFKLDDPRMALLELSKGRLTSDVRRHTGQGIYFTSRMFNEFTIMSGHLVYSRTHTENDDWLIETQDRSEDIKGTLIIMRIDLTTTWTTKDVFTKYQDDGAGFRKTHVPIKLGLYPGEQLVSRSQAKRILARFESFSEVMLDFQGVDDIGQAFADELFRVFHADHPDIKLLAINTSAAVADIIERVRLSVNQNQ